MFDIQQIADELGAEQPIRTMAPPKFARTPEDEQRIKSIATAVLQPYASTATIALMASRSESTRQRWQRELQRALAIQSLFTDPAKWEIIAGLIWPEV